MSWLPILPESSAGLSCMSNFFSQFQVMTMSVLVIKIDIVHIHRIISIGVFVQFDKFIKAIN